MQKQRAKSSFRCTECGHRSLGWLGKCSECGAWDSYAEELVGVQANRISAPEVLKINEIKNCRGDRLPTGLVEFDRVLGGGLVSGSIILIGGEPGIGKSTLLLQLASSICSKGDRVLLVSGEESPSQIKMRADRISSVQENFYVLSETELGSVCSAAREVSPDLLLVDSIQTLYAPEIASPPGSLAQVRYCSSEIFQICKDSSMATILIGHVTKDGSLAGPRTIEHLVDTVIYFEGDRHGPNRLVRAVKNRFGSTNEIAVFEMTGQGLRELSDVSAVFLKDADKMLSGRAISVSLEGSKPVMVEIQSLVSSSILAVPRRVSTGIDLNRLNLLLAVLEKRARLPLSSKDVFIGVSGGIKMTEPASDLAVALSVASAVKDKPIKEAMAIFGEVSLGGEVRFAGGADLRLKEAQRLGFKSLMLPESAVDENVVGKGLELIPVREIGQAIEKAIG